MRPIAKARQPAGLPGATQRASQHHLERLARELAADHLPLLDPVLGEGQVGVTRVLAGATPLRLSVTHDEQAVGHGQGLSSVVRRRTTTRGRSAAEIGGERYIPHRALDLLHLGPPAHMTLLVGNARAQKRLDDLDHDLGTDHPATHAEDVDAVVLDALVRGVVIVDRARADTADLAGSDRHAGTGTTDDDPALGP